MGFAAARAQAEPEVALHYRAPEACPNQAYFVAKLADRGGRLQGAESAARVERLEVVIEQDAESTYSGTLLVTAPEGSSTSREIHDPDCAKVVTGLAVVAAIALGGHEEGTQEAPAPAPAEPETPRPADAPRIFPPPSTPEPRLRGSSYGQPDSVEVSAGTLRFERDRRLTLSGGVDYGFIPELPMPRFDLSTSLGEFVVTPSGASRLVGPVLQIRWTMYGPASRTEDGRETEALGFGAGVALCSAITYDDGGLSVLGCGEFDVGSMAVETTEADGASSKKNSGFGTAGVSLDAEYSLGKLVHVGLRLGGRVQMGAVDANERGGQQDSDSSVFLGGYGTIALGLHF